MPRSHQDEAIVLRTYNVGETDRFCILLTKSSGKLAARAQGARKIGGKRLSGLLPYHRISINLEQHSFGYTVVSALCLNAHDEAWRSPQAFGDTARGIELVLKLVDEGMPLPDVYDLVSDFLEASVTIHSPLLVPVFTLRLLDALGLLPSTTHSCVHHQAFGSDCIVFSKAKGGLCTQKEDPFGRVLAVETLSFLKIFSAPSLSMLPELSERARQEIDLFAQGVLGSQLGSLLVSPAVSLALSSGVMPISHVSARAS